MKNKFYNWCLDGRVSNLLLGFPRSKAKVLKLNLKYPSLDFKIIEVLVRNENLKIWRNLSR